MKHQQLNAEISTVYLEENVLLKQTFWVILILHVNVTMDTRVNNVVNTVVLRNVFMAFVEKKGPVYVMLDGRGKPVKQV